MTDLLQNPVRRSEKLTPMMQQYYDIKKQHPGKILLFRLGDFFEIFGEDAVISAKILQIQLTARSKDKKNADPMCGIPAHSLDNYVHKLISAGKRVVICDQVGINQAKGLMDRKVVQVITPGTFFNDHILAHDSFNYIAALVMDSKSKTFGIALCDLSTGVLLFEDISGPACLQRLTDMFANYHPSELLLPKVGSSAITKQLGDILQTIATNYYDGKSDFIQWCSNKYCEVDVCWQAISDHFQVKSPASIDLNLNAPSLLAIGILMQYLKETQFTALEHLETPRAIFDKTRMRLDEVTIRNLEIFKNTQNLTALTLYGVLNKTSTPMGARALRFLMHNPFVDRHIIESRFDATSELLSQVELADSLRSVIKKAGDLERFISRLSLPNMSILYLVRLKEGLRILPLVKNILKKFQAPKLLDITTELDVLSDVSEQLELFLAPEPSLKIKEGNYIKPGINEALDKKRLLAKDAKGYVIALERKEKEKTAINSLKIGYNRIFGYYIEVSKNIKKDLPSYYIRKQTLANAERFTTSELQGLEQEILQAETESLAIEEKLYYKLCHNIKKETKRLKKAASLLAEIDVLLSFAKVAELNNYRRPKLIVADSPKLSITNGRHPVLESISTTKGFVPNDLLLEEKASKTLIITGPNMGGKSTFMRQSALVCYMAQIGSYVAADAVEMTIADRIFTRVGATDNLTRGQSTFMVEMAEAALIVKQATAKSLVILDELGRGTSTFDGIGIAWAIVEYLTDLGALTLFATHYHELIKLKSTSLQIDNCHVVVSKKGSQLVFTHKVLPGSSDKSYGIEVAKLAGLPNELLRRAQDVYHKFAQKERSFLDEKSDDYQKLNHGRTNNQPQLSAAENNANLLANNCYQKIVNLDLNSMSPMDCLKLLHNLQDEFKG